ncbi:SDR family NAD(P)-dependent oxidoreductase [Haloarcula sp. GH36]|uniref:SDR family NAD(P)-dependent oxidoreductase n=1 Tax=Haloarcula montana TaxID=3111776 RepID=UPI002D79CA6A|nr:SDR family NAD(P)-dependent oxidoreductase [Haloarcula sp. GH36]
MSAGESDDRPSEFDSRLTDRHIVVTGGAQGIGRGIVLRCAQAGADVTIFDIDAETAGETAARVRETGSEATVVEVDVADADSVDSGVADARDALGPIHGVVNNAGIQRSVPLLDTSEAGWDRHFAVNTKGTFLVAKRVAEQMIADDIAGSIVNISSVGAERPFTGQGAYGASKAAVLALTTVLAKELAEHGITANAIKPGTVETPMVDTWLSEKAAQSDQSEAEILSESLATHILDRPGQPEEIGHMAVLLLSDEGEWITGESIAVDGGYLKA